MAQARKDDKGRALRKCESQRSVDGRYVYTYTDPLGRRKFVYSMDLAKLREKEKKLMKDQLDGLDLYVQGKATINDTFDRYMATKYDLRDTTRSGYLYYWDHFVRETFGKKKLVDVKYSDVLQYYYYLLNEQDIELNTLDRVHCLLHPTFQLAVRDDIIRKNPTDGVMKEVSRKSGKNKGVRHALTVDEQRAFMNFIVNHPIYYRWWPIFTVLLGTGMRVGECLGLRWQDIDEKNNVISVNHSMVYYPIGDDRRCERRISLPKTEAGIRTIPLLGVVKDALEVEREEQMMTAGLNKSVIDGMDGFVFQNRYGDVPNPQSLNRAIKRITASYNAMEQVDAKKENRDPIIIPDFSCHHLRHTFATRLCEAESNLKVIQSVMGHRNIETTMDIYAEATEEKKQDSFQNLANKLDNIF